jgi:hypothetical protein
VWRLQVRQLASPLFYCYTPCQVTRTSFAWSTRHLMRGHKDVRKSWFARTISQTSSQSRKRTMYIMPPLIHPLPFTTHSTSSFSSKNIVGQAIGREKRDYNRLLAKCPFGFFFSASAAGSLWLHFWQSIFGASSHHWYPTIIIEAH